MMKAKAEHRYHHKKKREDHGHQTLNQRVMEVLHRRRKTPVKVKEPGHAGEGNTKREKRI